MEEMNLAATKVRNSDLETSRVLVKDFSVLAVQPQCTS